MIYLIQEASNKGAPIKIGFTAGDPAGRLASLQTGYPAKLAIVCTVNGGPDQEQWLHSRFKKLRLHGEWFSAGEEILAFIEEYADTPATQEQSPRAESRNYDHRWVESSGTTRTCGLCGCIKYNCGCCTKNQNEYSRWLPTRREWDEDKLTQTMPVCDRTRPVPGWIKEQI